MDVITTILSGFGLAAPAGLNAWLPLFITGLAHRFELVKLTSPFDLLGNTWVLVVLGVLLTIEVFADKIPAVDSINDVIHTFIRPAAGGVLFAAQTGAIDGMDPVFAFILGAVSAGGVHAVKAAGRPLVTATTGGIGNPLVSLIEDIIAGVSTILALIVPVVAAVIMLIILIVAGWQVWRWRERRKRRREMESGL
ncbi:MAG TPA: DUF4126 domain-containing protein [Chloroflexia bacterium]|nr:DUF4126 domain-containing protein [Chloroflexia bacterium]